MLIYKSKIMDSNKGLDKKRIVVVGGGFAGIKFLKKLSKDDHFSITLVDINNYHFFPPLLYQVATAFIEPSNISYPFRRMFQKMDNVRFYMGKLLKIIPDLNKIETTSGELEYDYLVLSLGAKTNYFGMENVKRDAVPMKTIKDALNMRNHLLLNMEKAVRATSKEERNKCMNIVIAGGGPTGVEIAGMLSELGKNVAEKEYPEIADLRTYIHLVDAAGTLLGPMSKLAQQESEKVLKKLGVRIKLNVAVKDYKDGVVYLGDGSTIPTNMLIWTSGVTGRELPGIPADLVGKGRRVKVNEFNQVIGMPNIYALGDICLQETDKNYPSGHPQLAQVAIQQGQLLAANFKRALQNETQKPFKYTDKGSMAIISKYKAVADLPKFSLKGFFAWLIWLFIHIMPLVGFRNKLKLAFSWFWSFVTNDPTLRLIIRPKKTGMENQEKVEDRVESIH